MGIVVATGVRDADEVTIGLRDIMAKVFRQVECGDRPDVGKGLQVDQPIDTETVLNLIEP